MASLRKHRDISDVVGVRILVSLNIYEENKVHRVVSTLDGEDKKHTIDEKSIQ